MVKIFPTLRQSLVWRPGLCHLKKHNVANFDPAANRPEKYKFWVNLRDWLVKLYLIMGIFGRLHTFRRAKAPPPRQGSTLGRDTKNVISDSF